MHDHHIASSGIGSDSHIAEDDHTYDHGSWVDMNTYAHQTTMEDIGGSPAYVYISPVGHTLPSESLGRLPSESLSRMPPPPPRSTMAPQQTSHPQLPMLIMPSHATWPSMLTNPNGYSGQTAAPATLTSVAPLPASSKAPKTAKLPALATLGNRKCLTDEDRRRMCQYAEDHPGERQAEIGRLFGVERSTVSKVLRKREKYLYPDGRGDSPNRKQRRGSPDLEKTLGSWVRSRRRSGIAVSDDEIKEKARFFAATSGNPIEANPFNKANSSTWLEKFKQRNGLGPRLYRRASETNIPNSARARTLSSSQPSSAVSPASPQLRASRSPLSAGRGDDDRESMANFMDFASDGVTYKHTNSQSTTSLSSAFTDTAGSSFSGSPFSFSPDPNAGGFLSADPSRHIPPGSSNFHRPRSQTFPTLDLEYMNQSESTEPSTPKYNVPSTAPSSALESPANEVSAPPFSMDSAVVSPQLRRSSSSSSVAGRATTTPGTGAVTSTPGGGSSPNSPTQEDARRAADTLLHFIQNVVPAGFVDQHEYITVVRLTEKLRLHQHQVAKAANQGMGGLSRIPEGDSEMPNAPPVKVETTMAV